MIVQACLNGARPRFWHPALPGTPAETAAAGLAAIRAGAAELHVHPRGADGRESLAPAAIGATVAALRAALPGTLIGVSTGDWIEGSAERTLAAIAGWQIRPDYASVNLGEAAAPEVIGLLRRLGVGVEAGLHSLADAERLLALELLPACLRILVELDEPAFPEAAASAEAILARVGTHKPVLLHGGDATLWRFVDLAAQRRLSTRVGLEDGDTLPDGSRATDNAAMVAAAVARLRA
jgi:uncharacterized protein (DUF849 family)